MDQQLIGFHLAMTEGTTEGLDHQGSVHARIQLPADDAAAEQIDLDSE
ncbi:MULTISPECIES: hypothetical protein [unclassified Cyanobium]|nr:MULTISPECIES: hypothetical protein [unclassified Cyanobium]